MPTNLQSVLPPDFDSSDRGSESAFYGRYSDGEKQRKSSMEDQVRECREEARRNGNYIPDANIFADPDFRGATESRPELDRLLGIIRSGKATFNDLYIADTSRLARNTALAPKLRKFFEFHNIRLHFVENGMKSGTSGFELQHTFQSYADEQFSKQIGEKVSRAQVGLVLKGYHPSGRCYGYRNVAEEHPTRTGKWGRPFVIGVRQVPYKEEVDIILDIMRMYAAGEGGYNIIAQHLNQKGIVSPMGTKKQVTRGWSETTVSIILNNERYIGNVAFGKTKQIRNPETLKFTKRKRPQSEWTTYHDESLRIVPDELWQAVKARQALVSNKIGRTKAGGMARSRRINLFSGLLLCGNCGNPMVLGSGTTGTYTCSNARRKLGCKNTQGIRRESLERHLIEAIATTIRSEANFAQVKNLFMAEFTAQLNRQKESAQKAPSQSEALVAEQKQLRAALHNLAEEIANFGGNEEMRSVRRRKEARLTVVTNLLKRVESPSKQSISVQEIDAFLRKAFAELADVLLGDPLTTQQELQKRISSLTLTPMIHNGEPAYEISGDVTLFCAEEVMMLLSSGTMTGEHHPFVIKLDGLLLMLDPHAKVTAVVRPRAAQADGVLTCRPFESVEDCTADAAWEDTHLSLSPPWLGPPIDGRGDNSNQKQMA
jgi:site-specific DNA recombinase